METNTLEWTDWIFNVYTLISWIIIVVIGTLMGFKQKIVVFRDYNDLGLVFLLGLVPIVLMYIFTNYPVGNQNIVVIFISIVEAAILLWIIIRTVKDNKNPISVIIALITKISLSVLFIINLLDFVTPSGKTAAKRASSRRSGFAFLLILTPIIFALVKNKIGFFNPERTLSSRGISV